MPDMEILPPAPDVGKIAPKSFWETPAGRVARFSLLGISATGCFSFVLWGVNQFLSLRGVVNVSASRIVLVLTAVAAISGWFISTRLFPKWRNGSFMVGAAMIVLGIVFLDWWAPKPQGVQPTSSSIDEKKEPKPPDIIAVTKTEPKNPTERKIRQAIGDLIQQGTKIRDKAPVYVGETPPDITSEWKTWAARVEKLLKGNFDSAEVAKFRSYNDPSQSLNSILHYEIGYLEALLDRVPSQGVPSAANNPPKQPQKLTAEVEIVEQKEITPSPRAAESHALRVTIQANKTIQPVHLRLECSGLLHDVDLVEPIRLIRFSYRVVPSELNVAEITFDFPPIDRSRPVVVMLYSNELVKVTSVRNIQ